MDEHMDGKKHQRIVLADPVALLYLEEDPSTTVLHRRTRLQGYEIYIVEQWACSRTHPTLIICTYTGDPSHIITVGVLSVPTDRDSWSPRLKLYFSAVQQYHAASRETPLGTLMVTNLSAFPSALTVIAIPDGDVRKHREDYIVNENLKRLGCAGRAGLKLQHPSPVIEAKFYQLYRASERVPLYAAVIELVKQCQIALTIFDKLAPEYVDGLLCDVTEKAISDWWADIGTDLYNIEPSDGILGATTVAALLGALMGARHRLHAVGAPVPKDVFDVSGLKRGIGHFQKSQKLGRTRRLDRNTLDRLHRASQKSTNSERWTGAVKSTVAELSGKGGEMVMGMVGRDRGTISDIETLDLERFAQLATGDRARWLWQGKPYKSGFSYDLETASRTDDLVFTKDDHGGYVWKRHNDSDVAVDRVTQDQDSDRRVHDSTLGIEDKDQNLGRIVSRSLTEKVSDARAGFGRFKDAVGLPGLRSHHQQGHHRYKPSKEENTIDADVYNSGGESETDHGVARLSLEARPMASGSAHSSLDNPNLPTHKVETSSPASQSQKLTPDPPEIHIQSESLPEETLEPPGRSQNGRPETVHEESENDLELAKTRSTDAGSNNDIPEVQAFKSLRRSQSFPDEILGPPISSRGGRWPRHLSFSTVEEVVLVWEGFKIMKSASDDKTTSNLEQALLRENVLLSDAQIFNSRVLELTSKTVPWVEEQVASVERMHQTGTTLQDELSYLYPEHLEEARALRERINQLLGDKSSRMTEEVKKVELLGAKLDYELNVLESKVEDVEEGLQDFERNVSEIEGRIKDLVKGERMNDTSWSSWFGRKFGHMYI
jgi:hypothetical protein